MAYINGKKILFGAPMTVVPGSGSSESYDKGYKDGQIALLEDSEYMKGTERDTNILKITDVSPVEHDLSVAISPIKAGKTNQATLYAAYTGTNNGLTVSQEGDTICLSGKVNNTSYQALTLPTTLENGRTYYVGLIYIEGTPEQYPINCAFMVYNPTTYYYEQKHEIVYGQTSYDTVVLAFENLTIDYTGCRVIPVISTEYVGIGCECTESVENISVSRYGKNLMAKNPIYKNVADSFENCFFLPKGTYTVSMDISDATSWRFVYTAYNLDGTLVTEETNKATHLYCPKNFYYHASSETYRMSSNSTQTEQTITTDNDYYISVNFASGDTSKNNVASNAQLEIGSLKTNYKPFNCQTEKANADGTVRGLTSLHPYTFLIADTPNVNIECRYYRDIDTYINNLITNVALTGGE